MLGENFGDDHWEMIKNREQKDAYMGLFEDRVYPRIVI
jgi:hypothetical protein